MRFGCDEASNAYTFVFVVGIVTLALVVVLIVRDQQRLSFRPARASRGAERRRRALRR